MYLLVFIFFINGQDDGIECTLIKFAGDTELGGKVDISEGRITMKRDIYRMETWANKTFMKFNKDTYNVLQLGKNNSRHQHRLGNEKKRCSSD